MSRPIRFRAWDNVSKKMYPVEQLSFHSAKTVTLRFNPVVRRHLDEVSLLQFTGLTDKNGTDIYEGDITNNGEVYWDEGTACFRLRDLSPHPAYGREDHDLLAFTTPFEVIGNIYENPELLEVQS